MSTENQLVVRLRDIICHRYLRHEPDFKLLLFEQGEPVDYDKDVGGETFADRVLDTIWLYSGYFMLLPGLARLAKLVQKSSKRPDLDQLVQEIESLLAAQTGGGGPAPPGPGSVPKSIPPEVASALTLSERTLLWKKWRPPSA